MEINGVAFKEPTGSGSNAAGSLAETFDTFLTLLTTQLKNQDPLDPLDSNQFTEQLVQFAGVEQSIATNKKLDQLVALQTSNQLNGAVSYIGKTVEVVSDRLLLRDGIAQISYGIEGNAAQTTINIVDQNGVTVRAVNGEIASGRHEFAWDGKDSRGNQLPDGVYGFTVIAVDSEEQTVNTVTATTGRVTGVEIIDSTVTLNIGELGVPFDSIFAVREHQAGS
ncbi:MAG: flagellar hook assembly protein FlgD [Kiloniellaceae bacterium]